MNKYTRMSTKSNKINRNPFVTPEFAGHHKIKFTTPRVQFTHLVDLLHIHLERYNIVKTNQCAL